MCFLPDNLEFLRAGGRCSNAAAIVGGLLKLKPCIEILGGKLADVKDYVVPGTNVKHRLVVIEKVKASPAKYPRAFAKIKKAPL